MFKGVWMFMREKATVTGFHGGFEDIHDGEYEHVRRWSANQKIQL